MRADKAARAYDPRIQEVRASYADELRNILVVASDGTFAEDSQPLARMNVSCIAKTEGNSARGTRHGELSGLGHAATVVGLRVNVSPAAATACTRLPTVNALKGMPPV